MEKKITGVSGKVPDIRGWGLGAGDVAAIRHSALRTPHSAFTLTELLVVITIIAILASLITAGAMNALRASKRAAITLEIGQLTDAMERFKTGTGGAYPPNAMNTLTTTQQNYAGVAVHNMVKNDMERTFRKAFPRHNEPAALIQALSGGLGLPSTISGNVSQGMNAAEAVYFWLGGFSSDPVYPISGPGGPSFANANTPSTIPVLSDEILENRASTYEFDLPRLGPRTEDGFFDETAGRYINYEITVNGNLQRRRINLWTYKPEGSESSYVYFDASRHDPIDYDLDMSGDLALNLFAVKKLREGYTGTTPAAADIHFVNKKKFQILHPGLDDAWGDLSVFSIFAYDTDQLLLFPTGPFTGDIADTLSNFSGGTLESEQE